MTQCQHSCGQCHISLYQYFKRACICVCILEVRFSGDGLEVLRTTFTLITGPSARQWHYRTRLLVRSYVRITHTQDLRGVSMSEEGTVMRHSPLPSVHCIESRSSLQEKGVLTVSHSQTPMQEPGYTGPW